MVLSDFVYFTGREYFFSKNLFAIHCNSPLEEREYPGEFCGIRSVCSVLQWANTVCKWENEKWLNTAQSFLMPKNCWLARQWVRKGQLALGQAIKLGPAFGSLSLSNLGVLQEKVLIKTLPSRVVLYTVGSVPQVVFANTCIFLISGRESKILNSADLSSVFTILSKCKSDRAEMTLLWTCWVWSCTLLQIPSKLFGSLTSSFSCIFTKGIGKDPYFFKDRSKRPQPLKPWGDRKVCSLHGSTWYLLPWDRSICTPWQGAETSLLCFTQQPSTNLMGKSIARKNPYWFYTKSCSQPLIWSSKSMGLCVSPPQGPEPGGQVLLQFSEIPKIHRAESAQQWGKQQQNWGQSEESRECRGF